MRSTVHRAPREDSTTGRKRIVLREPLGRKWENEFISETVEFHEGGLDSAAAELVDGAGNTLPCQLSNKLFDEQNGSLVRADVCFFCNLEPNETRTFTLRPSYGRAGSSALRWTIDEGFLVLSNSLAAFRFPMSSNLTREIGAAESAPAPVLGVRGVDGIWRGEGHILSSLDHLHSQGRLLEDPQLLDEFAIRKVSPPADAREPWTGYCKSLRTRIVESGPLFIDYEMIYEFDDGTYEVHARLLESSPCIRITERSDLPPGGAFVFSLHQGLEPDAGITNYWGQLNSYILGREDHLEYDRPIHLGTIPSHNLENFREIWYAAYSTSGVSRDMIGVFRVNGAGWSTGARIGIYQDPEPDLLLRFDLGESRREWCLFALDRTDRADISCIRENMQSWPYVYDHKTAGARNMRGSEVAEYEGKWVFENKPHYLIHLTRTHLDESPLDVVRKQHLDWEDAGLASRPVLWDEKRLRENAARPPFDRLFERLEASALSDELGPNLTWSDFFALSNRLLLAFTRSDPDFALPVKDYMLDYTRRLVQDFLTVGGNSATGMGAYNVGNQLKWLCWMYDLAASLEVFTADEDRRLRARMAYLAYKLTDANYFPFDRPEGVTNWNASRFKAVAVFGLCFPGHPESRSFVKHGIDHFLRELDECVFDSGAYIESTGYQQSMMDPEFAYLLRDHTDFDPFAHPRYKAMFRYFINMQTPKCPVYGRRTLPATGDVTWDPARPFDVLEHAAAGFAPDSPQLATQMVWTARSGRRPGAEEIPINGAFERFLRPRVSIAESRPALASCEIDGFGAVLRADAHTPDETYFALKCGAGWGHYHRDENSFTLFALGQPLALDSGKSLYGTEEHRRMTSVWAHNTLCIGGRDQTGRRGRVIGFRSEPAFDYVVGDASEAAAAAFRRHVLFVRNSYFVLLDETEQGQEAEFLLHVLASEVSLHGGTARFTGAHGVNLDAHFVHPRGLVLATGEAPVQGYGVQKRVSAAGRGPMVTVLVPYRGSSPIAVHWMETEGRLRISGEAVDDTVDIGPGRMRLVRPAEGVDVTLSPQRGN